LRRHHAQRYALTMTPDCRTHYADPGLCSGLLRAASA